MSKPKYKFLKDLNPEQLKAATTTEGPLLILAGAGSGKTKTIVARTAYILAEGLAEPTNILIMTFTNKAAREMKERGQNMLISSNLWKGYMPEFTTFHSWGVKFVKSLSPELLATAGINHNFTIADDSDQTSIINKKMTAIFSKSELETMKAKNLLLPMGNLQNKLTPFYDQEETFNYITEIIENEGEGWLEGSLPEPLTNSIVDKFAKLYIEYKRDLRQHNMVDFEDLINIPVNILSENEGLRNICRERYKYLMVDEFQDTNGSQLKLLNLLLGDHLNISVVGDDSQSIYGWRGANINYILNFHNTFKNTTKINLKVNYRSSKLIVKKANTLLKSANQKHEFKEFLEAFKDKEGIVKARFFRYSEEEAKYIANITKQIIKKGSTVPGEIAVLYRSAIVNRKIEVELIANRINYKIHRGKTLLERKAAIDIINYFKLLENVVNGIALSKVLISAKIVTDKRVAQLQEEADNFGMDLLTYLHEGEFEIKGLGKAIKEKIISFSKEVKFFKGLLEDPSTSYVDFIEEFFAVNAVSKVNKLIIKKKLEGEKVSDDAYQTAMGAMKIVDIVYDLTKKYSSLAEFLEIVALEGEEEDKEDNKVNLMTVHASKGLEFEYVFVAGFSQGVFPSSRNLSPLDIEEERRLAYVALTRAKHGLFVTGSQKYFGGPNEQEKGPSQFLMEAKINLE